MWAPLAAELSIPWRAAEAMHWQLGEADMARRAGVVPFSLATPGVGPGPTSAPTSIERSAMIPPSLAPGPGPYSMPGTPSTGGPHGTPGGYGMGPYHEVGRGGTSRREASLVGPAGGGLPPALSGAPGTGHGVLPSLAELERGMTAYDNGGGSGPTSGRYSSGGR